MTPSEANFFVLDEVTPRVFKKEMDDIVRSDWIRASSKPWVTLDTARLAIQNMVDSGAPFKVSCFVNAMKRIKPAGDAALTRPVLLFSILITTKHTMYGKPWTYLKGFYSPSEKKVPQLDTIQYQARYWAGRLKGAIVWAEGYCPIKESEVPF